MASKLVTQMVGIVATLAWSDVGTVAILALTLKVCRPRAGEQALADGLELSHDGEKA